jgi:hypothetical protein
MRANKNHFRFLAGSALLLACQISMAQTAVYKTLDDDGNVAFTDRPPLDKPAERVKGIVSASTNRTQLDADTTKAAEDKKYQQAANDIREQQANEDAEFQAAVADQQDAACRAANARLSKYKNARRLYRERPDGEREYLNDAELDAERAEAARAVDELCS